MNLRPPIIERIDFNETERHDCYYISEILWSYRELTYTFVK
jgi:hypothetical protein